MICISNGCSHVVSSPYHDRCRLCLRGHGLLPSGPSIHHMPICRVCNIRHSDHHCDHRLPACQFCKQQHVAQASNFKEAFCVAEPFYSTLSLGNSYDRAYWMGVWRNDFGPRLDRCFPGVAYLLSRPGVSSFSCTLCRDHIQVLEEGIVQACIKHFFDIHQKVSS